MNDALRGLFRRRIRKKSKNQSVRSKEFDLPPPLKDPNKQKHVAGVGIDSYEQNHVVGAGMEGGYLKTYVKTSVAPPIQTLCTTVPRMYPPTTVSAPYGGMQPQWGLQYPLCTSSMMPHGMAPWGPYPHPYYPPQPYGYPTMLFPHSTGVLYHQYMRQSQNLLMCFRNLCL